MIEVSVIIPVYNAAEYLEKAVMSALNQSEVKEVILVEDNSRDNSLEICSRLKDEYGRVKLYQHLDNKNLGAGLSRNLGIEKAIYPYVAFLDADDYYLEDRFKYTSTIFSEVKAVDIVCEVVGAYYYSESAKDLHIERMKKAKALIPNPKIKLENTGVEVEENNFEKAFEVLLSGKHGWLHLNGITARRNALKEIAFPDLKIAQDVIFLMKLSYHCNMYFSSSYSPVAVRGVHNQNRVLSEVGKDASVKLSHLLFNYFCHRSLADNEKYLLMNRLVDNYDEEIIMMNKGIKRIFYKLFIILKLLFINPRLVFFYVLENIKEP